MHLVDMTGFGQHHRTVMGAVEQVDGTVSTAWPTSAPTWPSTRSTADCWAAGSTVTMEDGAVRRFELEVPTDTGFHLGAGLYFGWQGHHHGEWRGRAPRRR